MANAIEMQLTLNDRMSAGLDAASAKVKSFASGIATTAVSMTSIIGVAAAVGGALTKAAIDLSDYVEQLDNLSASSGVSARNLQVLQFAFQQGGVDTAALNQGLNFLNRAIAAGSPELKKLGVTSKDTFSAFMQAANGLNGISSSSERAALMFQVFGRGGAQLAPILRSLSTDFDGVQKAAEDSGNVLSEMQLKTLNELDAKFDKITAAVSGMGKQMAVDAAGPLVAFAEAMERINKAGSEGRDGRKTWEDFYADFVKRNGGQMLNTHSGPGSGPSTPPPPIVNPYQATFDNLMSSFARTDTSGDRLGLRGGGVASIGSLVGKMVPEVNTKLTEAGEKFLEFAAKVEDSFNRIGDSVYRGFFTVLSNLTNKSQTFASAVKTIFSSLVQGVLDAMASLISSAITKGFIKLLGLALSALMGPGGAVPAGIASMAGTGIGGFSVSPGSLPGGAQMSAMGGGQTVYNIQTFSAKDALQVIAGATGSMRGANTRLAEIAAVS